MVVNDDLATLLASTDLATVVVDPQLRVQRSTVAAARLFNLRTSDIGRPLSDLASTLVDIDLQAAARMVMRGRTPIEREVSSGDGHHYLLRMSPFSTDQSVGGVQQASPIRPPGRHTRAPGH